MDERWDEVKQLWHNYKALYVIAGFTAGLFVYPFLHLLRSDITELLTGLVPEAIGIGFTVLLIDRINQIRENQRAVRELHNRLVREAGSRDNSTAVSAIDWMRNEELLTGAQGLLKGAKLYRANLSGANFGECANLNKVNLLGAELAGAMLYQANLRGSTIRQALLKAIYFREADLSEADLTFCDMEQANLKEANLEQAKLRYVNLRQAKIWGANLSHCDIGGSDLIEADLSGCQFNGTNLETADMAHAQLMGAKFDETTILPDGENWTSETDMNKFIDPEHPEYTYYGNRDRFLQAIQAI